MEQMRGIGPGVGEHARARGHFRNRNGKDGLHSLAYNSPVSKHKRVYSTESLVALTVAAGGRDVIYDREHCKNKLKERTCSLSMSPSAREWATDVGRRACSVLRTGHRALASAHSLLSL
jgi:hypothetical protein